MALPKYPLLLIGFFFLFTIAASQPMDAGVLESMGAPGDKTCLIALNIPGPDTSCDDRLRNANAVNVRNALTDIPNPLLHQVDGLINQIKDVEPQLGKFLKDLMDLVRAKLNSAKALGAFSLPDEDLRDRVKYALSSLKFADWLQDCMSWCESEKDTKGTSCTTKNTNMGSILDNFYCFSVA